MKLKVIAAVLLSSVVAVACGKKDDDDNKREKKNQKPKANVETEQTSNPQKGKSGNSNQQTPSTLAGTWDLQLGSEEVKHTWTFAADSVSRSVTCKDRNGKPFSASLQVPASFTESSVRIDQSQSKSASSDDGLYTCMAHVTQGEYGYQPSDDKNTLTLNYTGVVWTFKRAN